MSRKIDPDQLAAIGESLRKGEVLAPWALRKLLDYIEFLKEQLAQAKVPSEGVRAMETRRSFGKVYESREGAGCAQHPGMFCGCGGMTPHNHPNKSEGKI